MPIKEILKYPNPVLRKKAKPVTAFDEELQELVRDMADTMYDAPGVGLAAPQIGVSKQVVVMDISGSEEENQLMVLINPEISKPEGSQTDEEGCLSIVDLAAKVTRYLQITVKGQNLHGEDIEFEAEGWMARVIQHEIDHLHGVLFLDHLSSLKRTLYNKKRKKQLAADKKAAMENRG